MTTAQMFIEKGKLEGEIKGKNEGIAIGEAKLRAEKDSIARAMKLEGISLEIISRITGLPLSHVQIL